MKVATWSLIVGTAGYVQYVVLTSKCRSNHRRCSIKKVFLKISQNWQENTFVGVFFLKKVPFFYKKSPVLERDFDSGVFRPILRNFQEHLRLLDDVP